MSAPKPSIGSYRIVQTHGGEFWIQSYRPVPGTLGLLKVWFDEPLRCPVAFDTEEGARGALKDLVDGPRVVMVTDGRAMDVTENLRGAKT